MYKRVGLICALAILLILGTWALIKSLDDHSKQNAVDGSAPSILEDIESDTKKIENRY